MREEYMILHAHISGEGEPIVLLHSGGMTGLVEYEEQAALLENKIIKLFVLI